MAFSTKFNAACLHIASKLHPCGFDVSGVDTNIAAPTSLDELNACIATRKRLIVDGANSDNTIFADAEVNYAFRAWHDWCHWRYQLPFTLEGETRVALRQIDHIRSLYGKTDADAFAKVIWEEVVAQAEHYSITGEFPKDQRAFARHYLGIA